MQGTQIVVGVDGSEMSLGAARWATRFAERLDVPMRLVFSMPMPGTLPDVAVTSEEMDELHRRTREEVVSRAAAAVREWAPGVESSTTVDDQPPAAGLLDAARGAVMIVVGASGAGAVERWIVGSTALRVVADAHCPVAIWRGDPAEAAVDDRPILVGVDGSPESRAATGLAFEWADLFAVPITAVRTWTQNSAVGAAVPTALQFLGGTEMFIDWEQIARSESDTLVDILAPYRREFPDVTVRAHSVRGSAAAELRRELAQAQMLIVGNKGWGRFRGALLGSTSQNLIHHADRPVIVHRGIDS
ncbi:universal stress protein [Nocardia takedensis]